MLKTHTLGYLPALLGSVAMFVPFDGKVAGWKVIKIKNAEGVEVETIELKDGNPVWVNVDNTETTMGGDTITRLNGEAAKNRKDKETAEASLKAFEGLDATKAREAIEMVGKIDAKKLIDAGEVDRVKASIEDGYKEKLTASDARAVAAEKKVNDLTLSTAFNSSQFIKDKVAVPVDMLRAQFGNRFGVGEDGELQVFDTDGKTRLFSKAKQGEYADFEEGIALVIDSYSQKGAILKGGNQSGGGSGGGGGGGKPGVQRYSRAEFDALDPVKRSEVGRDAGPGGKFEIYDPA